MASSNTAAATDVEMMECSRQGAEETWADNAEAPSNIITSSSSSSSHSFNHHHHHDNNNRRSSINNNNKPQTLSVKEAWNKIHELRCQLANDVISDPPPTSDNNNTTTDNNGNEYNFPTFISPYEQPTTTNTNNTSQSSSSNTKSYKGMSIPLVYCDQTASHRSIYSIENYIREVTMPCYANTHTNITYTGSQSTAFIVESRQIVGESTNARITGKAALDTVLFGGHGVTGIVSILVDALNLKGVVAASATNAAESGKNDNKDIVDRRPVVFVGPHEHHSNLLPWRESGCEVVTIPEHSTSGMVDLVELERLLNLPQYNSNSGRLRMGAFSAVSNVTGLIANVDEIAIILHKYNCFAFFDYASGAPYLKMDMNPPPNLNGGDASKDAIYFSPHKCYGGISTPGVLVIKKHLLSQTNPPSISGGGTVFYVTNNSHRFLSNRIERYEGGTPDGIGCQRVGLALLAGRKVAYEYERIVQSVVALQEEEDVVDGGEEEKKKKEECRPLLPKTLLEYECSTYDRVVKELKEHAPNLIMLGTTTTSNDDESTTTSPSSLSSSSSCVGRHLPIFSFLIRCGKRFLHYNYVCAILNDVFGIQSRGGCQCAGPYSQRLLGLTTIVDGNEEVPNNANKQIERALLRSDRPCELLRPGYTRLSLPFKGVREEEVEYVTSALIWVAKNGWMLLPQYRCDHRTGEWRHWSRRGKPLGKSERRWLSHYDILASSPTAEEKPIVMPLAKNNGDASLLGNIMKASRSRLNQALDNANAILHAAKHDPRFLSEVEKMNSANGMLGSGGTNDIGEGGIDNTLEGLRWYVYQQEVSQYLRDGLEEVPETFVDDALVGALDVRMDGKRRNLHDEEVNESVEMELSEDVNNSSTVTSQIEGMVAANKSDVIPFQEGDHAGEAPYEEIKAGYEEGELSEACEVFSIVRDVWIPIDEFIQEYEAEGVASGGGRKRDLSAMESSSPSCELIDSMKIGSTSPSDVMDVSPPILTKQSTSNLPPAVAKREKKKPSRDSSQWGQSSAPHINPSTTSSAQSTSNSNSDVATATVSSDDVVDTKPVAKESNKSKKNKGKIKPPPKMMRFITQAMIQWEMIEEGDRLLLGLSGGKDSLSLLHCLLEFQRKLPIKFDIEVCTIDPMTPSFDPSPLIPYVEGLGLKYHYIRDDIVERASKSGKDGKTVSSLCAFCARMKRGNLYTCARKNNCNKLVLAQHLDDCAESFFMSIMHNGFIRTMKANYQINAGDVSVIRPLVYCRESLMTEFAKSANLPVINENCPACFEEPKERARVKKLLSREETLYPNLYDHIRRALIPVMHDDSTSIMRSYLEDTIAKSRKVPVKKKKAKLTANGSNEMEVKDDTTTRHTSDSLAACSDEELIAELARRRAIKYQLTGAMKRLPNDKGAGNIDNLPPDETGQMCSLTGGDGMVPCRELME